MGEIVKFGPRFKALSSQQTSPVNRLRFLELLTCEEVTVEASLNELHWCERWRPTRQRT
jgi:hypothetical protein